MSDTQKNLYKKIYGRAGERLAAKYLKRQGCKILKKNFAVKAGEIDIVALDGETLVFVEVKSRQSDSFGEPAEAVDAKKRKKYELVARAYLQRAGDEDRECRFDVIEVKDGRVNHIKNAFFI